MGLDSVGLEGNQAGYTIVNFAVMYIIGAFIRRYRINERIQSWKLGLLYLVCVVLLVIWATFESRQQNLLYNNSWIYCNPIVIAEAVIAFLFFLNLKIKIYPVINKLGSGVFTVFLLHSYFLEHIEIEKYVKGNSILMIGHIILSSVTIFALCTLIHFGYHAIMDPVYNHAFKRWNPIIVYLETGHEP